MYSNSNSFNPRPQALGFNPRPTSEREASANSMANYAESQMKKRELDELLSGDYAELHAYSSANGLWALCHQALHNAQTLRDFARCWAYVRAVLPLFSELAQTTLTTCAWRRLQNLRRTEEREQALLVAPSLLQRGETYNGMAI